MSPFKLEEGIKAAIAADSKWLAEAQCVRGPSGAPVIWVNESVRGAREWQVRLTLNGEGFTVWGMYYDFRTKDGRRIDEAGRPQGK
jgi:hypothetical protein